MKKINLILGVILCLTYCNVKAQLIEMPSKQDYTAYFDSVYQNVNFKNTPSGILYDRVVPFAQLQNSVTTIL